jgi:hypothetical protein
MNGMRVVAMAVLLLGVAGCAHNSIVGDGSVRSDMFFGDVGITGDACDITVLDGSRVTKLSLIGNDNEVTVEQGVTLYQIEFWGRNNVVSIPEWLSVRATQVGTNRIVRRPLEPGMPAQWEPYQPQPMSPEPAPWPPAESAPGTEPTTPPPATYEEYNPGEEPGIAPPPTLEIEQLPPLEPLEDDAQQTASPAE